MSGPYIARAGDGLVVGIPDGENTITLSAPARPPADLVPLLVKGDVRGVLDAVFAGQDVPALWNAEGAGSQLVAMPERSLVYSLLTSAWGMKPARRRR